MIHNQMRWTPAILVCGICVLTGCGSGARGTYTDNMGSMILELKSGGKANLTFQGDVADCNYTSSGKQVTLTCKGQAGTTVFNIHDDGSLTGPPGSFVPVLHRQK